MRFWKTIILVCVSYLAAALVIAPIGCIEAARGALRLCAEVVVPTLFPFFICANLLIALGAAKWLSRMLSGLMRPLFGIPGGGALAAVLGVVSGYPVGADCVARLYASGSCTKTEAERMLAFCNNSGPLFVMGAVGVGMLGSQKLGILLYAVHVLSALLTGVLFRHYGGGAVREGLLLPAAEMPKHPFSAVGTAVADAVSSILKVCGFVLVFAVFTAAIPSYSGSQLLYAVLEITGGIHALLTMQELGGILLPLVSFFLAFSGVSVLLQVAGIVQPAGLSVKPYLLGKLTQGLLAFGITWLALRLLPGSVTAFSAALPPQSMVIVEPRAYFLLTIIALAWSGVAIGILCLAAWICDQIEKRKEERR